MPSRTLRSVHETLKITVPNEDMLRGDVVCGKTPRRTLTVCDVDTVFLSLQVKVLSLSLTVGSCGSHLERR